MPTSCSAVYGIVARIPGQETTAQPQSTRSCRSGSLTKSARRHAAVAGADTDQSQGPEDRDEAVATIERGSAKIADHAAGAVQGGWLRHGQSERTPCQRSAADEGTQGECRCRGLRPPEAPARRGLSGLAARRQAASVRSRRDRDQQEQGRGRRAERGMPGSHAVEQSGPSLPAGPLQASDWQPAADPVGPLRVGARLVRLARLVKPGPLTRIEQGSGSSGRAGLPARSGPSRSQRARPDSSSTAGARGTPTGTHRLR